MPLPRLRRLIEREFEHGEKAREDLLAKRAEIDQQLTALDRRLEAAKNYRLTLEGRFATTPTVARTPRKASGPRAKRGELGGFRKEVYDYVAAQHGRTSRQVIDHFKDVKVSKVNAALHNLKKQGQLTQDGRGGQYVAAPEAAA